MSAIDHSISLLPCIYPSALVFDYDLDAAKLVTALGRVLQQLPLLAGRWGTGQGLTPAAGSGNRSRHGLNIFLDNSSNRLTSHPFQEALRIHSFMSCFTLEFQWRQNTSGEHASPAACRIQRHSKAALKALPMKLPHFISVNNKGLHFSEAISPLCVADLHLGALGRSGFSYITPHCTLPPYFQDFGIRSILKGAAPIIAVSCIYALCHVVALLLTELLCERSFDFRCYSNGSCMCAFMWLACDGVCWKIHLCVLRNAFRTVT